MRDPLIRQLIASLRRDRRGHLREAGESLSSLDGDGEKEKLKNHLYSRYYVTGGRAWQSGDSSLVLWTNKRLFEGAEHELRQSQVQDAGWTVRAIQDGVMEVEKDRLRLSFRQSGEHAGTGNIALTMNRVRPHLSPGFVLLETTGLDIVREKLITRWYFNVHPHAARDVFFGLASKLDEAGIEYRFKGMSLLRLYWRNDNLVLYTPWRDDGRVYQTVKSFLPLHEFAFRNGCPLFTKEIFNGVAVAEDPGTGESFGEHRCRLIAESALEVLGARTGFARGDDDRILGRVLEKGVDLQHPHVSAADPHRYDRMQARFQAPAPDAAAPGDTERAVSTIFEAIGSSARRQGGRLFWMRRDWIGDEPVLEACGKDAYGGLGGILWFLAEFHARTMSASARDLALETWDELSRHTDMLRPFEAYGLFSGLLGTLLIAHRVGAILHENSIVRRAQDLAAQALASMTAPEEYDIDDWIGGLAGTVAALVSMWRIWRWDDALERASSIGDLLIKRAKECRRGLYWSRPEDGRFRPLLGFSHGVGGIGLALAEVGAATGDSKYLDAGRKALAYERSYYSAKNCGWPDFRMAETSYPFAWCHGAPGVLLCHAISNQVFDGLAPWTADHERSLRKTEEDLLDLLSGRANLSQCHGVSGNADIVRLVSGRSVRRAEQAVTEIVAREIEAGPAIPRDPSLMLGLSGVGLFLLRCLDPKIPPPLALGTRLFDGTIRVDSNSSGRPRQ